MLKKGQRVILLVDEPDDNEELLEGAKGIFLGFSCGGHAALVAWDIYCDSLSDRDRYTDNLFNFMSEEEFEKYNGHFWWVGVHQIKADPRYSFPEFRKQKRGERIKEYRIAKKIYELDMAWKEKQNAKANPVSI